MIWGHVMLLLTHINHSVHWCSPEVGQKAVALGCSPLAIFAFVVVHFFQFLNIASSGVGYSP
jgi:hypothetical protein